VSTIFVFDSSALAAFNELHESNPAVFDVLDRRYNEDVIRFCDLAKDECRAAFQGEKIAIWVTPAYRGIRSKVKLAFADCNAVLNEVPALLDDDQDESEAQALRTMALAFKLRQEHSGEVVVVSEETVIVEDRCSIPDACVILSMKCLSPAEFLELP
jgi:hypothetical protein